MSNPIIRLNAALEGPYTVERELGEGGMAQVYLAEDQKHRQGPQAGTRSRRRSGAFPGRDQDRGQPPAFPHLRRHELVELIAEGMPV